MVLRDFLQINLDFYKSNLSQHAERSEYALLLKHGREMGPRIELPSDVEYGPAKECYGNATGYAVIRSSSEEYVYCEGYASSPLGIPCGHAWLINERGEVIDPTWRNGESTDCPYCLGNGSVPVEVDEDDERYGDEEECWNCGGSGTDFGQRERHDLSKYHYFGIEVPAKLLAKTIMAKGTYGILCWDTPDELIREWIESPRDNFKELLA